MKRPCSRYRLLAGVLLAVALLACLFPSVSAQNTLSAAIFSSGALVPPFVSGTLSYTMTVAYATGSQSITCTPAPTTAAMTITLAGQYTNAALTSGTPQPYNLLIGDNVLTIRVAGLTTYQFTIHRQVRNKITHTKMEF
jgi:hypothetical protein